MSGAILIDIFCRKEKSIEEKAVGGDREAFVYLINENRLNLYRVSKGFLKEEMDIEDAISETIVKAYKGIKTLKNPEYFKTWIIRILINECKRIIKKNKKIIRIQEREEGVEDSYENIDLIKAIDSLEDDLREVIILTYYKEMTSEEIGRCLSLNHNTVRTRVYRAKKKLYEMLKVGE
ncbi:MAG: sigma-70 family RNA polymerase sigma factor [Clostridium sp.]|uniref:sigma-70 family RNA polymerase sigma factor n=1 Tax=Clostridium sp. TaxID=1506 RepID=UPI003F2ED15F